MNYSIYPKLMKYFIYSNMS